MWLVFRKIDYQELYGVITKVNLVYLLPALVFFVLSKVVSAFRLKLFFSNLGLRFSHVLNIRLYWLGMFYNLSLPGGIGGDGYKVYFLNKRYGTGVKELFWAVMLDRVIGVLALFVMAVLIFYLVPYTMPLKAFTGFLIPASVLVAYLVVKNFFSNHAGIFARTNWQSFWVQVFQLVSVLFIMLSLGVDASYPAYMFVFLVSSIIAVLPFTIGGVGARELTFLYGARFFVLDENVSVAVSVLFFFITALVSLYGILYVLRPALLRNSSSYQ